MQNQKINPAHAHQTMVIVWASLFMSQLVFVVIVYFVKPGLLRFDFSSPLLDENALIVVALAAISIIDLAISFVLRKKHLDLAVAEQNVGLVQTAMIIGCSLAEAVSLFGLLLAFAFDYPYFYLFSLLGIIAMIFHFPRRASIDAASYKKQLTDTTDH